MSVAPRFSLRRLWAIARKEVIQLRRDTRSLAMAFLMPAVMILLFGAVITFDVRDIRLAVLDQDRSQASRDLVRAFTASGYFVQVATLRSDAEIAGELQHARAKLVLVIPPGFARAEERRFESLDALVEQMYRDEAEACAVLAHSLAGPEPWPRAFPDPSFPAPCRVHRNSA